MDTDDYQILCMSTWVKKKTYHQVLQIHTDTVLDIGCFFKSEKKKISRET